MYIVPFSTYLYTSIYVDFRPAFFSTCRAFITFSEGISELKTPPAGSKNKIRIAFIILEYLPIIYSSDRYNLYNIIIYNI